MTAISSNSSSDGSTRSPRSHGTIDPVELKKNPSKRKPAASWTPEEETVLIDFLLSQFSASGDGNPKGPTLTEAAKLLKERFLNAYGAEKTAGVCKNKWQTVCFFISPTVSYVASDQGKLKESMLFFKKKIQFLSY